MPRLEPFLGVAFAIATRPGDGTFILNHMHHVIWQDMPAVTNPDEIMWVRGGHGTNDSGQPARKPMFEADPSELRQILRKRFRIDLAALKATLNTGADGETAG